MNGHASAVQIHPSSVLASNTDDLSWVLYLEVVWTAKAFMKTVCPIAYAWVKGLLPKIHEVYLQNARLQALCSLLFCCPPHVTDQAST
jgi:hypothetical protein